MMQNSAGIPAQPDILARKRVLVVCTANVCRSPLVAALLQNRIQAAGLDRRIGVESAGVRAVAGYEVDPVVATLLDQMGIGLAKKFAAPVVESALRDADLVLVMEEAHRQALFYRLPSALPKIYLLSELAGRYDEISDPFGQEQAVYDEMLALITELLDRGWPQLLQHMGIKPPPTDRLAAV